MRIAASCLLKSCSGVSEYTKNCKCYKTQQGYFVYEPQNGVMPTTLDAWREGKHYVIKRPADSKRILTQDVLVKMKAEGEKLKGKPCDVYFEWSYEKLYCSELVWKIYKRGAYIEVGALRKLKDFRLDDPAVKQQLIKWYEANIPLDETVISPEDIFDSILLVTVMEE